MRKRNVFCVLLIILSFLLNILTPLNTAIANTGYVSEIIVDNSDNVLYTGNWRESTFREGFIGDNYVSLGGGNQAARFTWKAEIPVDGSYNIYINMPRVDQTLSKSAVYRISQGDNISEAVSIDQTISGWQQIGCYRFTMGEANIQLSAENQGNYAMIADAIKLVWNNETEEDTVIYADNSDPRTVKSGTWEANSSIREGYFGNDYSVVRADSSGNTYMIWKFDLEKTGYYKVYANHPSGLGYGNNISQDVSYVVTSRSGTLTNSYKINQVKDKGWEELGSFYFEAGENQELVKLIPDFTIGTFALADAVKLVYQGEFDPSIQTRLISDNSEASTVISGQISSIPGSTGWQSMNSTYRPGYYGNDYASCRSDASGNTYMRWHFNIEEEGYYRVSVNQPDGSFEASSITTSMVYTIYDARDRINPRKIAVSQQNPAGFRSIGTYYFETGDNQGLVEFNARDLSGIGMCDAVMLEYIGEDSHIESGNYTINLNEPRQTIWGLGIEVQSDSINSGNAGFNNNDYTSVPHSLSSESRERLYDEMLQGFRYLRLAGGLYYRGTDADGKQLCERWNTQNEELAELISQSGIEGVDLEFWSPTPYFKSTNSYIGGNLKCFSNTFTGNRQEFLTEFGQSIIDDIRYLENNNIPIVQFSIQNEPTLDSVGGNYSHCHYTDDMYYQTASVVIPMLKQAYPGLHIHANSWSGHLSGAGRHIINERGRLLELIDGWSLHRIGQDSNDPLNNKNLYTNNTGRDDITVYTTEYEYLTGGASNWRCINTAQNLMNWMTFVNSPTWHWLHMLKPIGNSEASGYALGFMRPIGNSNYNYSNINYNSIPEGDWIYNYQNWNSVRGFLKYMPWDSVRYDVTEDRIRTEQRIMSYKTPEGKQVIVLTNRSNDDFQFNINTGLNDSWSGYRYTPQDVDEIVLEEQQGEIIHPILPGFSIEFWIQNGVSINNFVTGIDITEEVCNLSVGDEVTLNYCLTSSNNNHSIEWESSDESVAIVDSDGMVTAVGEGFSRVRAIVANNDNYHYTDGCYIYVSDN